MQDRVEEPDFSIRYDSIQPETVRQSLERIAPGPAENRDQAMDRPDGRTFWQGSAAHSQTPCSAGTRRTGSTGLRIFDVERIDDLFVRP